MTDRTSAERAARWAVVRVCRRLWWRGLVAGPDGNVSVRLDDDRLLVTPSGGAKVDVRAHALLVLSLDGALLAGEGRPSSELAMHLAIYSARPDVRAVVHAHPPVATAFSVAGESLPDDVLPELICQVGAVALVPYFTPGTPEAHGALAPYLAGHDAFLLANHGATTIGGSLDEAHRRMESLEHAARIVYAARALGHVTRLTASQRAALPVPTRPVQHPPPPQAPPPGAPPDPGRGAHR
ncbi:MAG TPA: class II aldolase/adducin family protein [Gemmatirosa sp.]|nr:class II aldolase/adducin family protein [Gemmatirosa sp.]